MSQPLASAVAFLLDTLPAVAIHESAHALVATVVDVPIEEVVHSRRNGHCDITTRDPLKKLMITIAGELGERLLLGDSIPTISQDDGHDIDRLVEVLAPGDPAMQGFIRSDCEREVTALLRQQAQPLRRLAGELTRRRSLTGWEVAAILRSAA